ncbi:hypothetical protein A2U01_0079580, partial [Trifolium medium]|nr:hypothetical protein [Trifolium medium]
VVCDHDLWDPKPSKYVSFEETKYVECCYVCKWFSFHPLSEIIDSHYEIFVLCEPGVERSEDVHAPPGKRPRRG